MADERFSPVMVMVFVGDVPFCSASNLSSVLLAVSLGFVTVKDII